MQYKTIILELIQQQTALHEQLRKRHLLAKTLDELAGRFRDHHLGLVRHLRRQNPQLDETQAASEAMEIAVNLFEER